MARGPRAPPQAFDLRHRPGVEAGKRAAATVLALQGRLVAALGARPGTWATAEALAAAAGAPDEVETAFQLLERLAANPGRGVRREAGLTPFDARYRADDVVR